MAVSNSSVWYPEGTRCSAVSDGVAPGFSFSVCRPQDTSLACLNLLKKHLCIRKAIVLHWSLKPSPGLLSAHSPSRKRTATFLWEVGKEKPEIVSVLQLFGCGHHPGVIVLVLSTIVCEVPPLHWAPQSVSGLNVSLLTHSA